MRSIIIRNPNAGKHHPDEVDGAARALAAAGWQIAIEDTNARGDAERLARLAVDAGMDAVFVAGGDGTINDAIQGLAGSETALGYLPIGTVNVWARETDIPLSPTEAALAMADGRIERVDLGVANGRYFLLMAGLGFDSEVVRRAQPLERHKHRFGVLPYVASGLSAAPRYRGVDVELRFDGVIRRVHALMVVVSNTRLYGGRFQFTPNAVANDGWLDLCIVKGRSPLALARQSLPLLLSGRVAQTDVETIRVKELDLHAEEPLPFQLDGELTGTTPVHFRVAPRSLRIILPRTFASSLLLRGDTASAR